MNVKEICETLTAEEKAKILEGRKAFLIHFDKLPLIDALTREQKGLLFEGIIAECSNKKMEKALAKEFEEKENLWVKLIFEGLVNTWNQDQQKYIETSVRNKNNRNAKKMKSAAEAVVEPVPEQRPEPKAKAPVDEVPDGFDEDFQFNEV